jgi:Mg-chelatase subunit ChlD
MNEITKKTEQTSLLKQGKLTSRASPFQQRVAGAKQQAVDAATLANRICLMVDKSSSMSTVEHKGSTRIDLLKDAIQNFIMRCNFTDTAIAIESFPEGFEVPLTADAGALSSLLAGLLASGNTPMRRCVERCLEKFPMTRGVIVSDGEATDWYYKHYDFDDEDMTSTHHKDEDILAKFKEAGIPIDCVHISTSSQGEELLKHIAQVTGGLYIKFTDVSSFASAFGYLAPGYRAMLTDGRASAESIGAREVRS